MGAAAVLETAAETPPTVVASQFTYISRFCNRRGLGIYRSHDIDGSYRHLNWG